MEKEKDASPTDNIELVHAMKSDFSEARPSESWENPGSCVVKAGDLILKRHWYSVGCLSNDVGNVVFGYRSYREKSLL